MRTENENQEAKRHRYTRVAIILHWSIAGLILYNLASGLLRPLVPREFFFLHISSGITILLLSVARVGWRLTHRPPPLLPIATWERHLAHAVHFLLYAAILILPLSGWAMVSAKPPAGSPGADLVAAKAATSGQRPRGPTMIWGVIRLPLIAPISELGREASQVDAQHALRDRITTFHLSASWILLALLVLHVCGALKHQFIDRKREFGRIGLGRG
ncbi:MAG: cytochrome b [Candidatus Sphingomonas phytovorans]|nr:cytochrome b [Sphingomonas sp.]WEK02260.1 MAG: cytochrome b [Sphingomonas sp.]